MLIVLAFTVVYYLSSYLTNQMTLLMGEGLRSYIYVLNYLAYSSLISSYYLMKDLPDILLPLSAMGFMIGLLGLLGSRWGVLTSSLLASIGYYVLLYLLDKLSQSQDDEFK